MSTRLSLSNERDTTIQNDDGTQPVEFYLSQEENDDYYGIAPQIYSLATLDGQNSDDFWSLRAGAAGSSNFELAWEYATGNGVTVGIVDEGVNYTHVDLASSYDTDIDFDPRDDIFAWDAQPDDMISGHGTNVAGVIAGSIKNTIGTVGAAPDATITASYLRYGTSVTMSELAETLAHQSNYDVANNSWGFTNAFADNFLTGKFAVVKSALSDVVSQGRDGLGTVLVFAAGNGKAVYNGENIGDDANFHNLTSSRQAIAVGAHDSSGNAAFFSDPGTSLLLSAPGVGLLTTDGNEIGALGSSYVSGTSFAAPMVTSAVALMLQANRNLGYRDVQQILAISAAPSHAGGAFSNGAGHVNGGGLVFDRDLGFGTLDAASAVSLARNWGLQSTAANEQRLDLALGALPSADPSFATMEATLAPGGDSRFTLQWVELQLTIADKDLKGLRIELVSPDGTRAVIAENLNAVGSRTSLNFTFSSVVTMGESPYGAWRVELSHDNPSRQFAVANADLRFYGDYASMDDTYYYTSSYAALSATDTSRQHVTDANGGTDTLNFAASNAPAVLDLSGVTTSTLDGAAIILDGAFENAIGSIRNDRLFGSEAANRLTGDYGDDILWGRDGQDTLIGGFGNDTYIDAAGDTIVESAEAGTDTVETGASFSLTGIDNVENIKLTGTGSIDATGNELANALSGNDGDNRLSGGLGTDTLAGGAGNDTYIEPAGDVIVERAGQGVDTIETGSSFSLVSFANVENIRLTGAGPADAAGNDLANLLTGNAGDNRLSGGAGSDTLAGGLGNDTYVEPAEDTLVELAGQGTDTIETGSSVSLVDLANIENVTLTGSSGADATGNDAANQLTGNDGDNRLSGGLGSDTLIGGLGNDSYVDPTGDAIFELEGQGIDVVQTAATFSLASLANVENIILTGSGSVNATGNAGANLLTGNAGNNRLAGNGGIDTLVGGLGNDSYIDPLGAAIVELAGGGTDTVETGGTFSLATLNYVENLTLTGNGPADATGNGFANVLNGNSGDNRLTGGSGIDTLIGGLGNDTYVEAAGDVIREFSGQGNDTIVSSSTFTLNGVQNVENLTLSGAAHSDATGNSYANILIGNASNNRLRGADGLDTLIGGAGNDTYVDPGSDTIKEYLGQGTDTVEASGNFSLSGISHVENLLLTGTANSAGIGNSYDNFITGNAGSNRLRGGGGADTLDGGAGSDVFVFGPVSDSTGAGRDTIVQMNLNTDRFDFDTVTTGIATKISIGTLSLSSFDLDLSQAVGAGQMGAHQAVLFDPNGGDLNIGGHQFLVVDVNGVAGYQSGADYVVQLANATGTLTLNDFI